MSPFDEDCFSCKTKMNYSVIRKFLVYFCCTLLGSVPLTVLFFFPLVIFDRQKLDIPGVGCPVLLCPDFCHKLITDQLAAFRFHSVTGCNI